MHMQFLSNANALFTGSSSTSKSITDFADPAGITPLADTDGNACPTVETPEGTICFAPFIQTSYIGGDFMTGTQTDLGGNYQNGGSKITLGIGLGGAWAASDLMKTVEQQTASQFPTATQNAAAVNAIQGVVNWDRNQVAGSTAGGNIAKGYTELQTLAGECTRTAAGALGLGAAAGAVLVITKNLNTAVKVMAWGSSLLNSGLAASNITGCIQSVNNIDVNERAALQDMVNSLQNTMSSFNADAEYWIANGSLASHVSVGSATSYVPVGSANSLLGLNQSQLVSDVIHVLPHA